MDKIDITLFAVTPIFAGRDEPSATPELSPPALRGVLRYWFRALAGGIYGDDEEGIKALRQAECELFGGGVGGEEQLSSSNLLIFPLSSKLIPLSVNDKLICDQQVINTRQNQPQTRYSFPGLFYLYYSFRGTRKAPERQGLFYSYPQENLINLRIAFRKQPSNDQLKQLHGALWLLTRFGGIGSRTRHGAGNIQVASSSNLTLFPSDLPGLVIQAKTPEELAKELASGLNGIRTGLSTNRTATFNNPSRYDVIRPNYCKIWVINKLYNSWRDGLDEFGGILRDFRNRLPDDFQVIKKAMSDPSKKLSEPVLRAAFGLPLEFHSRSLQKDASLTGNTITRRSSPLIIRMIKLACNPPKYVPVLVWFRSALLPEKETLSLKIYNGEIVEGIMIGPDSLINIFLNNDNKYSERNTLRSSGLTLLEVKYGQDG